MIIVESIPLEVKDNSTLVINTNDVSYFTHGFFKYPCKFIPQIPRWAITKHTQPGGIVLDPFAGSGTTLVEASLLGRQGLGIDFDPLSHLLCKVKTTQLRKAQITSLRRFIEQIQDRPYKPRFRPNIHNLAHWFPKENIRALSSIHQAIESYNKDYNDGEAYDFLRVVFASIIKKCSYADDVSPKPYVSTKIKKQPQDVMKTFSRSFEFCILAIEKHQFKKDFFPAKIVGDDARKISPPMDNWLVDLAVTSPPYINAFDYVRSLRLENAWLGFLKDSNVTSHKRKQVGTETISSEEWSGCFDPVHSTKLKKIVKSIARTDKKRAFVVNKFFYDMQRNISEVHRHLTNGGHYVIVIGNSTIRNVQVPTNEILAEIARGYGFNLVGQFAYVIRNRYLRIPRKGRGGIIKKDWVIDLVKEDG